MPKQSRWMMIRKFDQSENDIDRSIQNLVELGAVYQEPHPEIYNRIEGIVGGLAIIKEVISKLKLEI